MSNEQSYFILAISTEFGIGTSIYTSYDSAKKGLYEFVQDWWAEDIGYDVSAPDIDTFTPDDAIDYYFSHSKSDEWYDINRSTVRQ